MPGSPPNTPNTSWVPSGDWSRLPALAEELGLPVSRLYEDSRSNRIPGQARYGKYILVHRPTFFAALRGGELQKKEFGRA